MNRRINALRPGQSIRISADDARWCTAERSGDGRTLRFVRHTGNGSKVFKTCNF